MHRRGGDVACAFYSIDANGFYDQLFRAIIIAVVISFPMSFGQSYNFIRGVYHNVLPVLFKKNLLFASLSAQMYCVANG